MDDFFRVRLILQLLDTCGSTFDKGANKRKLDQFLVVFQVSSLLMCLEVKLISPCAGNPALRHVQGRAAYRYLVCHVGHFGGALADSISAANS